MTTRLKIFFQSSSATDVMKILLVILSPWLVLANVTIENSIEDARIDFFIDLITLNLKNNGWNNIITYGHLPDSFYKKIKVFPFTFITSNTDEDDFYIEDVVPYHSNTILINCFNFTNFEQSLRQVMNLPYWHPHANIIIIYNKQESKQDIARLFFILWYYRASNAIIAQYDDLEKIILIFQYNPFVVDDSWDVFGCRTKRNIGMPINTFEEGFVCEERCHNVSITSKHRHLRLGTCIGLRSHKMPYNNRNDLTTISLFEDRGKNLDGFALRSFATEVPPFTHIKKLENGTYLLESRDGTIWTELAQLMNFAIDLSPSAEVYNKKFNFELNIQQIFSVAHRKGDLILAPIYQFDVIVVELDYSFAYKDSGVCFMAHKASFETVLFDFKFLQDNLELVIEFFFCVLCIWLVFFLYSVLEADDITVDLLGKNFMNTVRSVLSITLHRHPKRESFRYFLTIILWCFFVLNFSTQAAIVSFFSAFKRGKEVETFADIADKGYKIQGMASPDVLLPEDNELFQKINSRLDPINDIFSCVKAVANDSHRFCLMDCSVGRYMQRNLLNAKGEQYLHIAKDRVHNYYLNFIFPKYSIMTNTVNKYLMAFFEAGLIKKWEQYRFNDIKQEAPMKPLGMEEFNGVFKVYFGLLLMTFITFLLELVLGSYKRMKKVMNWNRSKIARKVKKLERKQNKI